MVLPASAHRRPLSALTAALVLVLAALLAGCGGDADATGDPAQAEAYTQVEKASIEPGDDVPAPTEDVVLTITGGTTTNVGDELQLDLPLLEQMGVVEYEVFDRQALGRRVTFSGPLLRSVLEVAGVPLSSTLNAVALNDYAVDLPASDARKFPVMLATRADGRTMTVEKYGPTRIVYPTGSYDLPRAKYDPRWIWQLSSIAAR